MVPEGWRKGTFVEGIDLISGQHVEAQHVNETGDGHPYLTGPADFPNGSIIVSKYTDQGRKFSRRGDILITVKGSGTGKVIESEDNYAISRQLMAIRATDFDPKFTYYNVVSSLSRYEGAAAGLIPGISREDVLGTPLLIPPLHEQVKIAQTLSTWDQAITATGRLLENSQQRKKGLMQQLLTGKNRFIEPVEALKPQKTRTGEIPGDWNYPKIASICSQVTDKNTDDLQLPVLSCSKYVGFVDSLSYFKKKVYSDDLKGYRIIPRGCIGFPANHIEEGSIGLQNLYDYGLVSPIYVVARPDPEKVNADYLYAVFKTDHYRQIFCAATNASVDRRGSLRWKEFSQIHVPLPPLSEQNKMVEVLQTVAQEISSLQTSLKCLKEEKKALMQQLLTGKRRVNVDMEAA